jgi:hypothetical protein
MLKKFLFLSFLIIAGMSQEIYSQLLLEENFDYPEGDSLKSHDWINYIGTQRAILVTPGSLSYDGYPSSGIGNSSVLRGGKKCSESVYRNFTGQNTIYASLLVNVCYADKKGDFFFHLGEVADSSLRAGIFIKDDCHGNLLFGVSKGSPCEVAYAPFTCKYDTTYLLVLKYESVGDSSNDDIVKLFIDPFLDQPEPDTGDVTNIDTVSDITTVDGVGLHQGPFSCYKVSIDGIRICKNWSCITPVELTSFSAFANQNEVFLKWKTATELNNSGFEIERKSLQSGWLKIGFVPGCGTTTAIHEYSFSDKLLNEGKYSYRLKQVDFNGSYEYSKTVEVDYNVISGFKLAQNYPNPFNPTTTIRFSFDKGTFAELKVFDVLGNEVATLFNETADAGKTYKVNFNASSLGSGVYYYRLSGDNKTEIKKMIVLK